MSKTRNLSDLLDANGDVKSTALDNAPSPTLTGIDDNADATAITIDSSERVGIGTPSPSSTLDVVSSGTNNQELLEVNSASGLRAKIATDAQDDSLMYLYDSSDTIKVAFRTDGNASYINGGGKFGIGTSSPDRSLHINTPSTQLKLQDSGQTDSFFEIVDSAGIVYMGSRNNTNNGDFVFRGLNSGGASEYLRITSEGLHLGGTGSANALSDYEEGTFTPTFGGAGSDPSSVSWNIQSGTYTKVGNQVFARAIVYPSSFSGGSGNWNVRSLPFTANANSVGTMMWDRIRIQASYPGGLVPRVLNNTTYMEFPEMNDWIDEASNRIQVDDLASNFYLELSIVYTTNS